jgi:hypothetical protein
LNRYNHRRLPPLPEIAIKKIPNPATMRISTPVLIPVLGVVVPVLPRNCVSTALYVLVKAFSTSWYVVGFEGNCAGGVSVLIVRLGGVVELGITGSCARGRGPESVMPVSFCPNPRIIWPS